MIRRREPIKKKGWFESFIDDYSFMEKLILMLWCTFPYFIFIMLDWFDIWIRVALALGIFIISSLLCYWFGVFMSSEDRDWYY